MSKWKDLQGAMDQVEGKVPRTNQKITKDALKDKKWGGLSTSNINEAFDQIFAPKKKQTIQNAPVVKEQTEMDLYKRVAGLEYIKDKLNEGVNIKNVEQIYEMVRGVISEI